MGPQKPGLFVDFCTITDVRCVTEASTWCNELSPGRESRQDQLQFAESFSRSLKT